MRVRTTILVLSLALLIPSARAAEEGAVDSIKTSAGDLQITCIGHATLAALLKDSGIDAHIRKMR